MDSWLIERAVLNGLAGLTTMPGETDRFFEKTVGRLFHRASIVIVERAFGCMTYSARPYDGLLLMRRCEMRVRSARPRFVRPPRLPSRDRFEMTKLIAAVRNRFSFTAQKTAAWVL